MARREVHVDVKVHLVLSVGKDVDPEDVLQDIEYSFESQTPSATVQDSEIRDWDVGHDDRSGEDLPHLDAMSDIEEEEGAAV